MTCEMYLMHVTRGSNASTLDTRPSGRERKQGVRLHMATHLLVTKFASKLQHFYTHTNWEKNHYNGRGGVCIPESDSAKQQNNITGIAHVVDYT